MTKRDVSEVLKAFTRPWLQHPLLAKRAYCTRATLFTAFLSLIKPIKIKFAFKIKSRTERRDELGRDLIRTNLCNLQTQV